MDKLLTAGVGLKPPHYQAACECRADGLWFEVHPENYFVEGGPRLAWLEAVRALHPLSLHSVSLSLASEEGPGADALARLCALARRVDPVLVSEHLAWSSWNGNYYPDLLPFPRNAAALHRLAVNIDCVQNALQRRIAIENPAHYLRIAGHEWDEIDFLVELCRRTGCGLLLDVNNVYVAAHNLSYPASSYIDRIPAALVMEIHLAGHSTDPQAGEALLIDSHAAPVAGQVWRLYERLLARIGPRPTLIERDANLPEFTELLAERMTADAMLRPPMEEQA